MRSLPAMVLLALVGVANAQVPEWVMANTSQALGSLSDDVFDMATHKLLDLAGSVVQELLPMRVGD